MSCEGWAWGTTDGGEWLTIPGSVYAHPTLHPTAGDAPRPTYVILGHDLVLARVREVAHHGVTVTGLAYRILEVHAPQERGTP